MHIRRRLTPCLLAATTAALLLGGCSSGSGATAAPAATTATATSTPSSDNAAESAAGDDTSAATATESTEGSKVFAEPAECASIAQTYGAVVSAMLPVLQGKTGSTPFDAEGLGRAVKGNTMGTIPKDLTPDFATFTAAAEQLRGKDLTAAAAVLNGPEVTEASNHINKFLSDHC